MCDLIFITISCDGAHGPVTPCLSYVGDVFVLRVINDGVIYQRKRTGVYSET